MAYNFSLFDKKLTEAREWLSREYQGLRTGRATPSILDSIHVSAYGSHMPLKQVASISVEDSRTLRVAAFDQSLSKEVEKAIAAADLGLGVSSSDATVRVTFPELTSERRQEFVKLAKQKMEEARVAVRSARDDVWSDVQAQERDGALSEDEKFRLKDEIQKKVDTANNALEEQFKKKEQEMMQ